MKRFRLSSILFAAAALCATVFTTFIAPAVELVVATGRAVKNLVLDGFKLAANQDADARRAVVWFVVAKAFVQRLAKRERLVLTASWRMCPST